MIRLDDKPLSREQGASDTLWRDVNGEQRSYVMVQHPRMYSLVDTHEFGEHVLELICPEGLAAFAFTFTSCVDSSRSAVPAVTAQS